MKMDILDFFYNYSSAIHLELDIFRLLMGVLVVVILFSVLVYFVFFLRGKKEGLKKTFFGIFGIFFCIGIVVVADMIANHSVIHKELKDFSYNSGIVLKFCDTGYICVNKSEWFRQLIECISFIPLGVILVKQWKKKPIILFFVSMLVSIGVEWACGGFLFSKFSWQTILFNGIGAIIGIGATILFICKKRNQCTFEKLVIYIGFFILTAMYFVVSYFTYYSRMFGNRLVAVYDGFEKKTISIEIDKGYELKDLSGDKFDEQITISNDEIMKYAELCFEKKGKTIDKSKTKILLDNETDGKATKGDLILYDSDKTVMFIVKKSGFLFVDNAYYGDNYLLDSFDKKTEMLDGSMSSDDKKNALVEYGIEIDEKCRNISNNDASCWFKNYEELNDGVWRMISVKCDFFENNEVGMLEVGIYFDYKECGMDQRIACEYNDVILPEQAFEKIKEGKFYVDTRNVFSGNGKIDLIVCDYNLQVRKDNFNCLQYVYCFYIEPITTPDGTEIDRVFVPALKNYYE